MGLIWTESARRIRESSYGRAYTFSSAIWDATSGRSGGPAFTDPNATIAYPISPAPSGNRIIFGIRIKTSSSASVLFGAGNNISNTVNPHLESAFNLNLTVDGRLQIRRGTTVLGQTAAGTVQMAGVLQYIAADIVIDPTNGSSVVYLDGNEVTALTLSGVNTANAGETSWNSFFLKGSSSTYLCDIYVLDGTATGPHDLIPDARVDYVPVNGNGYSSQFTGSDSNQVNNYQQVDENSTGDPDDDSTYNEASAAAIDGYTLGDAPEVGATIIGVTAFAHARKTDAGTAPFAVGLRRSGANYLGTTHYLPISYVDVREHHGVDPATGLAWTESNFNAAELVIQRP